MAWDDVIPEDGYESAIDQMEHEFREYVLRRALDAGVEVDQFESLQACDLYLQSIGR